VVEVAMRFPQKIYCQYLLSRHTNYILRNLGMEIKSLDYWVSSFAFMCRKAGKMPALLY